MKCVADTSAISWLERIGYLELLTKIYQKIWVPPGVPKELKDHIPVAEFIRDNTTLITFRCIKDQKRFERLVKRWLKKTSMQDRADIEVFIAYKFFTEADEALYANKGAEQNLVMYGAVRDIATLYEIAEQKKIFTRTDSLMYLEALLQQNPPYRSQYVSQLFKELR